MNNLFDHFKTPNLHTAPNTASDRFQILDLLRQ